MIHIENTFSDFFPQQTAAMSPPQFIPNGDQPSHLLRMSDEILMEIIKWACTSEQDIDVLRKWNWCSINQKEFYSYLHHSKDNHPLQATYSLNKTCKKLYFLLTPFRRGFSNAWFYSLNMFRFPTPATFLNYSSYLQRPRCDFFRHITLVVNPRHPSVKVLSSLNNLPLLELYIEIKLYPDCIRNMGLANNLLTIWKRDFLNGKGLLCLHNIKCFQLRVQAGSGQLSQGNQLAVERQFAAVSATIARIVAMAPKEKIEKLKEINLLQI